MMNNDTRLYNSLNKERRRLSFGLQKGELDSRKYRSVLSKLLNLILELKKMLNITNVT